jgi:N-methylhydantoinase B
MRCTIYNASYRHPLTGYLGGHRGAGNYWVIREGDPDELRVTESCYAEPLPAGSSLFAQSGAGGGWGDPLERAPERVLSDLRDEYISPEAAREIYGVVVSGDPISDPEGLRVDEAATTALRADLARARMSTSESEVPA